MAELDPVKSIKKNYLDAQASNVDAQKIISLEKIVEECRVAVQSAISEINTLKAKYSADAATVKDLDLILNSMGWVSAENL